MPLFCRHNRLTANCPICSKDLDSELRAKAPTRSRAPRRSGSARGTEPRRSGVVTRRMAREADDGYRNALVPGIKATADAERLGGALAWAAARLEPPGPLPPDPDLEQATWVAFLLALTGEDGPAPTWASGELPDLPEDRLVTVRAYRAWAERAGSQAAAFAGEPGWTPARRFGRVFQRLALPGFARAQRFELLATLAAAGLYELEADSLHIGGEDDDTTLAAKRVLSSGDTMLLERRARELAEACGVPLAALDRGLAEWGAPGASEAADPDDTIRAALRLP
jgi:hypothetical protein